MNAERFSGEIKKSMNAAWSMGCVSVVYIVAVLWLADVLHIAA